METEKESVTREFDDEQYKLDEEQEEEEAFLQTMERANELSEQYEEVKDRTLGENLVAGRLEDIDTSPANDNINVTVDLPGEGNNKVFRFKKPKVWTEEYDFVRWIKHYGYDADSFPNMLKAECDVKVENVGNEKYKLFIPEREGGRDGRLKEHRVELKEKIGNYISAYRQEDNNFYVGPILLFFNIVHGLFWLTPIVDYGFIGEVSAVLWAVTSLMFLSLWFLEAEFVKTEGA